MSVSTNRATLSTKFGAVIVAACAVVAWRVTALALVYMQRDSSEEAFVIKALLAILGMTFLGCGLLVFWKMPSKASLLFAWYCICSGLHWGGPLDMPPGQLRTGLILFYLLVSSILGSTLLLQFALHFPMESRIATKKSVIRFLYAPVIVGILLAAVYLVSPSESGLRATTEEQFLLLHTIVSNLFPTIALAFVSHILRAALSGAQKKYVGVMVIGMLAAWLPYLVVSAVGVGTDPWNLTEVALPITFAIALFGMDQMRERQRHA